MWPSPAVAVIVPVAVSQTISYFHTGVFSRGVGKTYSNSFAFFFFFPLRVLYVLLPPVCWMIPERVLGSLLGQLWSAASSDSPRGHNPPDGGGRQQKGRFLMQMGHRTPDSQAEGSTGTDGRELGEGGKGPAPNFRLTTSAGQRRKACWALASQLNPPEVQVTPPPRSYSLVSFSELWSPKQ